MLSWCVDSVVLVLFVGTEAAERLEVTKSRLEKELRRRSDEVRFALLFRPRVLYPEMHMVTFLFSVLMMNVLQFQEIVSSRNMDIQEEYERMLKELDDQTETLAKVSCGSTRKQYSQICRANASRTRSMRTGN